MRTTIIKHTHTHVYRYQLRYSHAHKTRHSGASVLELALKISNCEFALTNKIYLNN